MFKLRKLEDRIVLDGAGIIEATDEVHEQDVHALTMSETHESQELQNGDNGHDSLYIADEASSGGQDDGEIHLLVISSDISEADILASAAKDGVLVLQYDAANTTLEELSDMIHQTLGGEEANTIAFVTHSSGTDAQLNLTQDCKVTLQSLDSDADQRVFWEAVGDLLADGGRIDLLACNVAADEAGEDFVAKIEELAGANVAASTDATGNEAYGGDWVLESDGVDIQSTYFDADELGDFDGVLAENPPAIVKNSGLTIDEDGSGVITGTMLTVADSDTSPDIAVGPDQITYTLTGLPTHGKLYLNGVELTANSTFTQADINAGNLSYTHNTKYEGPLQDRFYFTASDDTSSLNGLFNITINPVNDAPKVSVNNPLAVDQEPVPITGTFLRFTDADDSAAYLTYTLTTAPTNGSLYKVETRDADGNSTSIVWLTAGSTFTQSDINAGDIFYERNDYSSSALIEDTFQFTVQDDGGPNAGDAPKLATNTVDGTNNFTFTINVQDLNEAPVFYVDSDPDNAIWAIDEGVMIDVDQGNRKVLDNTILNTVDPDVSDGADVLIYKLEGDQPVPEYGTLYLDDTPLVAGDTFTQEDINNERITYKHNGTEGHDEDSFTFKVYDDGGLNKYGKTDQLSTSQITVVMNINNFNDAPTLDTNETLTVNETNQGASVSGYLKATDVDLSDGVNELTYTIETVPTYGTLYRDDNNDTIIDDGEALAVGDTFTQADIDSNKIKYTANADFEPTDTDPNTAEDMFTFKVSDNGGEPATIDQSYTGALFAIEPTEDPTMAKVGSIFTFNINITPENDQPVLIINPVEMDSFDAEDRPVDVSKIVISNTNLDAKDPDNTTDELTYTLISSPMKVAGCVASTAQGFLYLDKDGTEGYNSGTEDIILGTVTNKTFTQADINNGYLKYNYNGTPSDVDEIITFDIKVTDNEVGTTPDTDTFTIILNGTNQAPVAFANNGLTVYEEDDPYLIRATNLHFVDADTSGEVTYILTEVPDPTKGFLYLDDDEDPITKPDATEILSVGDIFTQSDIGNKSLYYDYISDIGVGGENVTDVFKFTVHDVDCQKTEEISFNVTVQGDDDAPVVEANTGISLIDEDASMIISSDMLAYTDPDRAADAQNYDEIIYTLKATPYAGYLFIDGQADGELGDGVWSSGDTKIEMNGTFTQTDINAGNLIYQNTGETSQTIIKSDRFEFDVSDLSLSVTGQDFDIQWKPNTNDDPRVDVNEGLTVTEGDENTPITNSELQVVDQDDANPSSQTYTLLEIPVSGTLYLDGTELFQYNTFTQADINSGKLTYTHNSDNPDDDDTTTDDSFKFYVTDDGLTNGIPAELGISDEALFNIFVTPVNDPPDVTIEGKSSATVAVASSVTIGKDQLYAFDELTDATLGETSPELLTYTITELGTEDNSFSGTLFFNGETKIAVGSTFTQADINDGKISFTHDGVSYDSTEIFTFTVTDDVQTTEDKVFTINVTGPPVVVTNTGGETDENSTLSIGNGNSDDSSDDMLNTEDPDDEPDELIYTITKAPANGTLYVNENGVDKILSLNSTFTQADLNANQVYYEYSHDKEPDNETDTIDDSFDFRVSDSTGASTGENTFNIKVSPVNDNPIVKTNTGLTATDIVEDQFAVITQAKLEVTDGDPEDTSDKVTYTLEEAPTQGTLWFDDNGNGIVDGNETALVNGSTFTQAQVNEGKLTYWHHGEEPTDDNVPEDGFTFTATDGHGGNLEAAATFYININNVNDDPRLTTNAGISVWEGDGTVGTSTLAGELYPRNVGVINDAILAVSDGDNTPAELEYTITGLPTYGKLYLNGIEIDETNNTFTQDDINNERLIYKHEGGDSSGLQPEPDTFNFTVTDGNGSLVDQYGNPLNEATFIINVYGVNDSPEIIIPDQSVTVTGVKEITDSTEGDPIAVSITDPDAYDGKITVILKTDSSKGEINVGEDSDATVYGEGTIQSPLIIEGTKDAVNNVLATLTFTGKNQTEGVIKTYLVIDVNDNGNSGVNAYIDDPDADNAEGDSKAIEIWVDPAAEPNAPPDTTIEDVEVTMFEDTTYPFSIEDFGFEGNVEGIYILPIDEDRGELITLDGSVVTQTDNNEIPIDEISGLKFKPTQDENGSEYATFQFRAYGVYNGVLTYSDTKTITVNITPINDTPEIIAPDSAQIAEVGSTLKFSGIKIDDPDLDFDSNIIQQSDPEGEVYVKLHVDDGILTVEGLYANTVNVSNGGKDIDIRGTLNEVNGELASLEYTYTGAVSTTGTVVGADTLTISTNDSGIYGGLPLQDTETVDISIIGTSTGEGGGTIDDTLTIYPGSIFIYTFEEFAGEDIAAQGYTVSELPSWLSFNEDTRTFWYVPNFTGVAEPTYNELYQEVPYIISVTAEYPNTSITDTFELWVESPLTASLDTELMDTLQMLDENGEYNIPVGDDGMAVQEMMLAQMNVEENIPVASENTVDSELLEALNLLDANLFENKVASTNLQEDKSVTA